MPGLGEFHKIAEDHGMAFLYLLVLCCILAYAAVTAINKWKATRTSRKGLPSGPSGPTQIIEHIVEDMFDYHRVVSDLTKHAFFASMKHAIRVVIPHIPIEEPMRRIMFRDFLTIKVQVFHDNLLRFVSKGNLNDLTVEAFHQAVSTLFTNSISEYEHKCTLAGIDPLVIDKFAAWHARMIQLTFAFVDRAANSNFYPNNTMRMVAVLDWLTASLQATLIDAEDALGELNGELDGKTYKGVKAHCKTGDKCSPCERSILH